MAAPVISISSDLSDESVGSSILRVILIGSISVEVLVAPKVGAAAVASPVGVLELDTHSSSEADPSKSSPPLVYVALMVSPFLCSDDSESDTELPERHIPIAPLPPTPSAIVALSTDIISPVNAPPGVRRRRAILIRPGQDIPIGRLYRTYPGGPCRALTARKSIRPLPSHRLALRYTSHHLDHFTSGSSSDHSSLDHSSSRHSTLYRSSSGHSTSDDSSFGHSISGHSSSGHTLLVTTIVDSSTPSRFVYPPPTRTSWYREAFRRWRSAPLSTMYPPMTFESSARDSSSESSAGPSRKRCRSLAATVTSSIHALGALVLSRADLLPPRKRFRDSISPEDSIEEDIDIDVLTDIEADATAVEVATCMDVEAGVNAGIGMEVDVGVDIKDKVEEEVESSDRGSMEVGVDVVAEIDVPDGMLMLDVVERLEQVKKVVQDIYGHVMEIPLRGGETLQGTLMMESERADRFRRRMGFMESELRQIRRLVIMTITLSGMTLEAIEELINQRVVEALAAYKANRVAKLAVKSQSHNGDDDDNGNDGGNGNGNGEGNGDGNGRGNGN
ncbi:hypothetical protein Tco_0370765 [Tanacetum coccineum]